MTLPTDTCEDTLAPGTPGPGGRDTAFPSACGSASRGTCPRAMGGTGRLLGKTFFLRCQRRHPELPKIPTYLPGVYGWGFFGGGLGGVGGGGGWGDYHRHTDRWFGGWFWSITTGSVDTLVLCTSLPLINIGAFLTICIQNILDTIGYFSLGN